MIEKKKETLDNLYYGAGKQQFDFFVAGTYIKDGETNIIIPSAYGILPYPNDKIKFEQAYLRPTNDVYPIFAVTNVEKSVNTDKLFWKLKLEVDQSYTTNALDLQVSKCIYIFRLW